IGRVEDHACLVELHRDGRLADAVERAVGDSADEWPVASWAEIGQREAFNVECDVTAAGQRAQAPRIRRPDDRQRHGDLCEMLSSLLGSDDDVEGWRCFWGAWHG